jgi:dTDP-4-amino-4,6-dideoxygalactose transaminase
MGELIPHNRPLITAADRAAVDAVLTSGWIAEGPAVQALEARMVRLYGGGGACAVSSGTAALFLALKALGAASDTIVAVPTYTCSALLNAVFMAGTTPRVVDVLPDSFCLDPDAVASAGCGRSKLRHRRAYIWRRSGRRRASSPRAGQSSRIAAKSLGGMRRRSDH